MSQVSKEGAKTVPAGTVDFPTIKGWKINHKGMTKQSVQLSILYSLEYNISKDSLSVTPYDQFLGLSYAARERVIERWISTAQKYKADNVKRVYYLSMEFLMGRLLGDTMMNLKMTDISEEAVRELGLNWEELIDQEHDAGLGNGGLGRLAACYLDSMASLKLPSMGYGIRYDFGIFNQKIVNGFQHEMPEQWLQSINPWEIERAEYKVNVKFYGRTMQYQEQGGRNCVNWVDTENVIAMPYDIPVPGYGVNNVNTLRLWSARSADEFNLQYFNNGDYIGACHDKFTSENISKILYPNDNNISGKELRLKQQFFFSSASLQDIIRRYLKTNKDFKAFADKVSIQLNDTHPSIAIAELMRLFIDEHRLNWDEAWGIVQKTFAYTNHTLMPEALEKWSVGLMTHLLPRHIEIIYDINAQFLREVSYKFPGDLDRLRRMSLIEEGDDKQVRMAYLAIAASHSVNGVSALHTELLINGLVKDFYEMWPEKFNNKTNGITQRRWLYKANPSLRSLINGKIGDEWVTDLFQLKKLEKFADDKAFRKEWAAAKLAAKQAFVDKFYKWEKVKINPNMMFDVQVKRIHEYKRQLMNVLHCIELYNRIKNGDTKGFVPRTVMFAGKAAPGYYMAKLIIKFINNVAGIINNDPAAKDLLRVHFLPNYRVSLAEYVIPAADLSEQISTAGTEASGTGNMKFALNGALTIGTMDGANVEMHEEIGNDNIFIFGLRTNEVGDLQSRGYNPKDFYNNSPMLKQVVDLISSGYFSPEDTGMFNPIVDTLMNNDRFLVMADFDAYVRCQEQVAKCYSNQDEWVKKSILNVARMGKFSSDRAISEYAKDIWGVKATDVKLDI
ncbi:MAG: glycogen/starch/alpha-glucan phosphorylase [Chitinispirillia bacterium]|nr:glycogen/starch/alpha-glucan phosphorylase [Chitinispirillia bacterium]MCL2268329.1 glycogen/starch/alpha-glucan phosphorylase [Chitinispirillia bacterium]